MNTYNLYKYKFVSYLVFGIKYSDIRTDRYCSNTNSVPLYV